MTEQPTYKLRRMAGVQTIRLDPDSLDYAWKGSSNNFQGTLPYENLRMNAQFTSKNKADAWAAMAVGLMFLPVIPLMRYADFRYVGLFLTALFIGMILRLLRRFSLGSTIHIHIEPQLFGFGNALGVPDTKKGRAFLDALHAAWEASLRRRYLAHDCDDALFQQRIRWLEYVGVLGKEEAMAQRALAETNPPRVPLSAVN